MKSCPRCGKQYPDGETFCETDGSALIGAGVPGGRVTKVMPAEERPADLSSIECPVCGGKAQPGEAICNFCGARLPSDNRDLSQPSSAAAANSQNFAPAENRLGPQEFGDEPAYTQPQEQAQPGRRLLTILGFSVAALVALAAGAWLALYLASKHGTSPMAQTTPPSPTTVAPVVELTTDVPVRVQNDQPGSPARDSNSLLKAFEDNKPALTNVYSNALSSDSSMRDGMVVRLHVLPDGRVDNGAVRVSTSGNPSFDAEVIQAMTSWKFPEAKGSGVTADYQVIFVPRASDAARVEADLNSRLAGLSPEESPEYAFAPSGSSPTAALAASPSAMASSAADNSPLTSSPSPAAVPTEVAAIPGAPSVAMPNPETTPPEVNPRRVRHRHHAPRAIAALPPPKPPLIARVNDELRASRKLRRVQAYTNGSVVTIFGKVFDKDDRLLAERTVRNADGVSGVIDNVTTDTDEWARDQDLISQALQNAGFSNITVKVIGHDAYLSGEVKSEVDREHAVTVAQAAAPVKVRENLITVALGNMLGF
jgi:TonB family protein